MNLDPLVDESWKDIITHVKGLLHTQVWFGTVCVCQCMSFRVCDSGASGLSSQEIQLQKVATKSWFIANYLAMKPWNGCLLFFNEGKPPSPRKSSVELVAGNWWYDQDAWGCCVFFSSGFSVVAGWATCQGNVWFFFVATLIQKNLPPCYSILHDHDIFFLNGHSHRFVIEFISQVCQTCLLCHQPLLLIPCRPGTSGRSASWDRLHSNCHEPQV